MSDSGVEFTISVRAEGDIGTLEWSGATTEDVLAQTVSMAADDAIMGHQMRRLEISLPAPDMMARRAVHQAGFRLEGIKRQALAVRAGEYVDVALYSRVVEDQVYGPEGFSGVMTSVLPKTRALAHCLLRNEAGLYLFLSTCYKRDWELPGGVVEPHEPPHVAAAREVAEELGIEVAVGELLAVDWLPPYLGWDDALQFIFDGGTLSAQQIEAMVLQEQEIAAMQWATLDEATPHLHEEAARRLTALLTHNSQTPLYLEAGIPR